MVQVYECGRITYKTVFDPSTRGIGALPTTTATKKNRAQQMKEKTRLEFQDVKRVVQYVRTNPNFHVIQGLGRTPAGNNVTFKTKNMLFKKSRYVSHQFKPNHAFQIVPEATALEAGLGSFRGGMEASLDKWRPVTGMTGTLHCSKIPKRRRFSE